MKFSKLSMIAGFIIAFTLIFELTAHADEDNQSTKITFSEAVQVPGRVLPAGTYQFKLADPNGTNNVLEIRSADGSQAYGMLMTIPEQRSTPTDEPVVTFEERAAGSPEAIHAVFYPGETTGMAFVYPTDHK